MHEQAPAVRQCEHLPRTRIAVNGQHLIDQVRSGFIGQVKALGDVVACGKQGDPLCVGADADHHVHHQQA